MGKEYETTTVKGGHTIYLHGSIEERRRDREEIKDLKERLNRVESLLMQINRYFDEGEISTLDLRKVINEIRAEFGEEEVRNNDFLDRVFDELDLDKAKRQKVVKPQGGIPLRGPLRGIPINTCTESAVFYAYLWDIHRNVFILI